MTTIGDNSNAKLLEGVDVRLAMPLAEDDIEELVREIIGLRSLLEAVASASRATCGPLHEQLTAALAPFHRADDKILLRIEDLKRKVRAWQDKRIKDNPFAFPRDVCRVVIDGQIKATIVQKAGWEITDPNKVPREYCSPDRAKIDAHMRAGEQIEGVMKKDTWQSKVL